MFDSDYFCRDKLNSNGIKIIDVRYGGNENLTENLLHDGAGKNNFPTNGQRATYLSYLINVERNIQSTYSYNYMVDTGTGHF